jgi:hypothetical protein
LLLWWHLLLHLLLWWHLLLHLLLWLHLLLRNSLSPLGLRRKDEGQYQNE